MWCQEDINSSICGVCIFIILVKIHYFHSLPTFSLIQPRKSLVFTYNHQLQVLTLTVFQSSKYCHPGTHCIPVQNSSKTPWNALLIINRTLTNDTLEGVVYYSTSFLPRLWLNYHGGTGRSAAILLLPATAAGSACSCAGVGGCWHWGPPVCAQGDWAAPARAPHRGYVKSGGVHLSMRRPVVPLAGRSWYEKYAGVARSFGPPLRVGADV